MFSRGKLSLRFITREDKLRLFSYHVLVSELSLCLWGQKKSHIIQWISPERHSANNGFEISIPVLSIHRKRETRLCPDTKLCLLWIEIALLHSCLSSCCCCRFSSGMLYTANKRGALWNKTLCCIAAQTNLVLFVFAPLQRSCLNFTAAWLSAARNRRRNKNLVVLVPLSVHRFSPMQMCEMVHGCMCTSLRPPSVGSSPVGAGKEKGKGRVRLYQDGTGDGGGGGGSHGKAKKAK